MKPEDLAKAVTEMLSFNDVTKAHYLGLDDTAKLAFLEKSAADRTAEAQTAADVAKNAAEAEAAKAQGKTAREVELEKRLNDQQVEIDALKGGQVERDLEKRATAEFDGFPGGSAKVVELLKAAAHLPEAARTALEDGMKTTARVAKSSVRTIGFMDEDEAIKAAPATAELKKRAKERATEKNISEQAAQGQILREDDDLKGRVLVEERLLETAH